MRSLARLQKQFPFCHFQEPVRHPKASGRPIKGYAMDADAAVFCQRSKRLVILAIHVEDDKRRSASVMFVRLVEKRL